jgi:hypothetical protein
MTHFGFFGQIKQVRMDRILGKRLKGEGGDEFLRAPGQNHVNVGPLIRQAPQDFTRLVGGDPAADPQDDFFVF